MKIFGRKKRNWWNKKTKNWTGRDMTHATGMVSLITTLICGAPFVALFVKEKIDG